MVFIIKIVINLRNLVYINHSQMKNLWKGIELNEEQVKFLTSQVLYAKKLCLQYYIIIEIISIIEIKWLSLIEIIGFSIIAQP